MKTTNYAPAVVVIETLDGRTYCGATFTEAIQRIRADAWGCTETNLKAWMRGVARRAGEWSKAVVRADTVENFVLDMEASGLFRLHRIS